MGDGSSYSLHFESSLARYLNSMGTLRTANRPYRIQSKWITWYFESVINDISHRQNANPNFPDVFPVAIEQALEIDGNKKNTVPKTTSDTSLEFVNPVAFKDAIENEGIDAQKETSDREVGYQNYSVILKYLHSG